MQEYVITRPLATHFANIMQPARRILAQSSRRTQEENAMGPFPHDAPPAEITADNPAGTDGFEFVEFAHPEPEKLEELFDRMGYAKVAQAPHEGHFALAPGRHQLHPQRASRARLPTASWTSTAPARRAMAWRVVDAQHALKHAVSLGAEEYTRRRQVARRAGDHRHRRLAALFRRPLRREGLALRRRIRVARRARPETGRASASTISIT